MKRRTAISWLLVVAAYPLARLTRAATDAARARRGHQQSDGDWKQDIRALRDNYMDDLKALTGALLPTGLGQAGTNAVAVRFVDWLDGQRPDAELNLVSYKLRRADLVRLPGLRPGVARAVITGSNYRRQLDQLRSAVSPRKLSQLDRASLSAKIISALEVSGAREIPVGPGGANLLVDLLSFYYRQPAATNLFHSRRIDALHCRTLDGIDRAPLPIAGAESLVLE